MKENILYFDWYVDDRIYSLQYAGIEDDLAVLETENYIIYLTIIGDTLIKKGSFKYKSHDDFPSELKELISKNGIKEEYGSYKVLEKCYFNYCISKKIGDEEEFLCCFNTFNQIGTEKEEKTKMSQLINDFINIKK